MKKKPKDRSPYILVADDDPGIVDATRLLLEEAGYRVETTADGGTLIKAKKEQPALILLDIWMSGMNGSDICRKMKSDPKTRSIPIVLFSANRDTEKIANEVGADGFISKPFQMAHLLQTVEKYITL